MKLYILTEGFAFTGYGHVARCLAIAKSFRNLGIEVTFIVNGDENVRSQLHDFPLIASDWPREYPALQRHLSVADFLLVDSYLAPKNVYDDLAARGVKFQLNLPSLTGMYGREAQKKSRWLLRHGLYAVAGTDLHRSAVATKLPPPPPSLPNML